MKRLIFLTIALALALPAAPQGATHRPDPPTQFVGHRTGDQSWQYKYQVWMSPHAQRLAACESGSSVHNLNWTYAGSYDGAFGFAYSTWDSYKPVSWWPRDAHLATPWQQYVVARRVAAHLGIASPWGCWRGDSHAWVRGNEPYDSRIL